MMEQSTPMTTSLKEILLMLKHLNTLRHSATHLSAKRYKFCRILSSVVER